MDEIMAVADLNGNGELDYSEWLVATLKRSEIINTKRLKQAFQYFDKDGSGKISLDELKEAMGSNGQDLDDGVWEDIMAEGDENGDGEIDFDEFKKMMKKLLGHRAKDEQKDGEGIAPRKSVEQVIQAKDLDKASPFRLIRVEKKEKKDQQQGNN